ncbi:MAG TPA: hypothetical protein VMU54_23520, partial [Planctomycetota bacterium]|nr:hypothetical protein [Planctomycetota bacterium]
LDLMRVTETLSGAEIQPTPIAVSGGNTEIEDKRFAITYNVEGPGKYQTQISLPLELQELDHVAEVKKRTATKKAWQFEFLVWGDDLIPLLSPKLMELSALVAESREFLKRLEQACQSAQSWAAQSKVLTAEGNKLTKKISNSDLRAYYPAAMDNLYFTMRGVVGNSPYYTFGADGKFAGAADYHADNKKVATFRNEDFTWENLKRYVEESLSCAGREFSLWIVKDLRRTAGLMRSEIQDAVKAQKAAPGVEPYAERLAKATISDLDGLEADIRNLKK